MKRSKKIFLAFAVLFFVALILVSYDFYQHSAFPGTKKQRPEMHLPADTVKTDSIPHLLKK